MTYGEKIKEFVEMHSPLYKIYEFVTNYNRGCGCGLGKEGGIPQNFGRGVVHTPLNNLTVHFQT